jgi:RNA recognition motif-containing protein
LTPENEGWETEPMRAQFFRGNVFVANLPPDLTEEQLAEAFDPFGIVLSAFIARDPDTGKRLRYGFVDIATEKAAKLAVESMNGVDLAGYHLDVRISDRRKDAKKPAATRRAAPRPTPRRAPADGEGGRFAARPAPPRLTEDGDPAASFTPRPTPRRQPTFQVERRPLPRRV